MSRRYGTWAVAGAVTILVAGCGGAGAPAPAPVEQAPLDVTVAEAMMTDRAERLEAGGTVTAATSAAVSSRVTAQVVALRVRAGDRVRAGQVLVQLDDRMLDAGARQATASVAAAEQALAAARSEESGAAAEVTLAEAWQSRIATLGRQNSATLQELDEANARLAAARARLQGTRARIEQGLAGVDAARAALEASTTTRSFAAVTAPFDGLVTETLTDAGSLAVPGVPLVRLDGAGATEVHARVDEARAGFVGVGDRVDVLFAGPASAANPAEAVVEGTVREVGRDVGASDRAFTVKVTIPGRTDLRAGSFARLRFRGTPRRVLTIPQRAIRQQGQVATVFVVDSGVARMRIVNVGPMEGDHVEVLAGLDAGELVVADVPLPLTDGRRVTTSAGGAR